MSRGPGRIEKAIERLFVEQPDRTFSTDDLAKAAYPALDHVEKRHRVAILRAADKVAQRLHWEKWQCERLGWGNRWPGQIRETPKGRGAVFVNPQNIWSYAQGRLRIHWHDGEEPEEKWNARLGQGGDLHKLIQPDGVWSVRVQQRKAEIAGMEPSAALRALIEKHEREAKAFWNALPGKKLDDAERARRQRRKIANMDASLCARCGKELAFDEPIVRYPMSGGQSPFTGRETSIIELQCLDCCDVDERRDYYRATCLTCERVVYQRPRRGRFRTFCCELHRRRYYRNRRRAA